MKGLLDFLKTTFLGGFFVLLPVLLVFLLLGEVVDLVVALGTPIAGLLPEAWLDFAKSPELLTRTVSDLEDWAKSLRAKAGAQ